MEEKTYAVFSADSVNAMAEAAGLAPLAPATAAALGEDASYRLRQVVMLATQYMKHSKRRRLSVEDFNRAVKELGLMPVCGHGSQEPVNFRQIKDTEMHCVEDPEVSLCDVALGSFVPRNIGQPSIKAHWLAVEGTIKMSSGSSSQNKAGRELSKPYLQYYNAMTKSLMSSKPEIKKKALQDLKSNPNIVPVLPYLVNFVVSGIRNMSHDLGHLTCMLDTVRALLHNRSLYLMHKPYLNTLVYGVEFCVLEPLAASISSANDHWILRDYAARLLAEIVHRWNSPQNHLRFNTIKCLREVWLDKSKPFYSHYGAISTLIALGHKAVEEVVLPHMSVYWPHLRAALEDTALENRVTRSDSQKVYGALRVAAEKVLRKHLKDFEEHATVCKDRREVEELLNLDVDTDPISETEDSSREGRMKTNVKELYDELYEYFGDSLTACLPMVETQEVFRPRQQEQLVSLGDDNSGRSGEELLENLMEQIQRQEKLEQERKERERQEKIEREKRERERQAKEAIRRRKREEEERQRQLKREEEEYRRRQLEHEDAERQRKLRDQEERLKELNKNRTKPQWQQEIELRRLQLEEEIQYSKMMEARKRQELMRHKPEFIERKPKKVKELEEDEDDEDSSSRSRAGLRRRKPVNYTEKDEDISDLFEDLPTVSRQAPRLSPTLPPHSDISDYSDDDTKRLTDSPAEGIAVSKVIDPSKGLLKLKIKRQGGSHSSTPPHPMSATPQHTPSYHSPSMHSPLYSPVSSHSTPPPPSHHHHHSHRSKSSSGSEKESKHRKSSSTTFGAGGAGSSSGSVPPRQSRAGSAGIQDISDPEEPLYEKLAGHPSLLYSPGGESSGSDSNPHRKALRLKLKLTPKESASE